MRLSTPTALPVMVTGALVFAAGTAGAFWGGASWWVASAAAAGLIAWGVRWARRADERPLLTAAAVLDAIRQGEYAHRARELAQGGPTADLLRDVNALASHLQSERIRAEEASALLQAVVRRMDIALLAFDSHGDLRWWNPAAGHAFQDLLREGTSAEDLGVGDWLSGEVERTVALPGSGDRTWELKRGTFRQQGERFHFVLLTSVQRVQREEERIAWRRLLRVIGHEVNNTLSPISSLAATGLTLIGKDKTSPHADLRLALEVIAQRAEALGRFVGDFSRLAHLPKPVLVPLDLSDSLRRVAALDARCPLEVRGSAPLPVRGDGVLIEQALVNLLRNAVDAALLTGGGVRIDWSQDSDFAQVWIVDDGPGFANPDNLFVPLFSTKRHGAGIGLVLARDIAEAHGGELRLENRSRTTGCRVSLRLPLAQHSAQASGSSKADKPSPSGP